MRGFRRGETVIIGAGEVGQTITSALTNAGVPHTVLDQADEPGVDVVGDATVPKSYVTRCRHSQDGTLALSADTDTDARDACDP